MSLERKWISRKEGGRLGPHTELTIVDSLSGIERTIERYPVGLEIVSDDPPHGFHPDAGSRVIYRALDLNAAPPTVTDEKISIFGSFNVHFGGPPVVGDSFFAEEEFGDETSVELVVAGEDFILCHAFFTNGTGELNRIRIRAGNYDDPKFGNNPNEVTFKKEGDLLVVGKKSIHGKAKMNTIVLLDNIVEVNFEIPRINRLIKTGFLVKPSIPYQRVYELASTPNFTGWEKVYDILSDTVQEINPSTIMFE